MSLASQVNSLATRVATEFKAVRAEMALISGGSDPWTYAVVSADVSNSTVTAANVTGLTIPSSLATGTYVLEGKVFFTSAATTTGMQLGLTFPAQVDLAALWQVPAAATTVTILNQTASAVFSGNTAAPGAAPLDYVAVLDSVFKVNSAMSAAINVQQRSEIAASAVTAKAGSFLRYRKIA